MRSSSSRQSPPKRVLPQSFYRRDTVRVARDLLGKILVRWDGDNRRTGAIVETEAYLGTRDAACHSFGGRHTKRTATMYLPGGHAYVYFTYGMHHMFNVVTRESGDPEAVLIRALEPREGLSAMARARGLTRIERNLALTNGPGKLCRALGIDRGLDGVELFRKSGPPVFIEESGWIPAPDAIACGPRVGVAYAGEAAAWPLRFWLRDSPWISGARTANG